MEIKWIDLGDGNKILVEIDEPLEETYFPTNKVDDNDDRLISGKSKKFPGLSLLEQINSLANMISNTADTSHPDEVEITGQIKFSGETGIPIFVKAKGETSFQIKLSWKRGSIERGQ